MVKRRGDDAVTLAPVERLAQHTAFGVRDEPFPHIVLDNLWQPHVIASAHKEFDLVRPEQWHEFTGREAGKAQITDPAKAPPSCSYMLDHMASAPFRALVAGLFDLPPLTCDLLGGGLHRTREGGKLDMHVDFNVHPGGLYRRVNVLVFLNDVDRSGDLILMDAPVAECNVSALIVPKPGRTVMFVTGEQTWHGHPSPLKGVERRSLAAYYYSTEAPPDVAPPHDTIYP